MNLLKSNPDLAVDETVEEAVAVVVDVVAVEVEAIVIETKDGTNLLIISALALASEAATTDLSLRQAWLSR